jgi:hypothetical protein
VNLPDVEAQLGEARAQALKVQRHPLGSRGA